MKRSIKEQIDILRNSIEWGLQNHPDVPIFCREAADTMEIMQARIKLLEKENERLQKDNKVLDTASVNQNNAIVVVLKRQELLEKVVERVHKYELRVDKKDWPGRTKNQIEQAIEISRLEMFLQVSMLEE